MLIADVRLRRRPEGRIMTADTIRCTGRAVDDTGQPVGEPCGRTFRRPYRPAGWLYAPHADAADEPAMTWQPAYHADDQAYIAAARAAGWAIGGSGMMCPQCRRPDPTLTRLCHDLTRSTQ